MAQDRFMALDALALMRHSNASWKLLASDDAAFCCAFFYQEFLAGNVRNLPEARLLMDMRPFLKEKHALAKEPQPEEEALEGEAKQYLRRWSDEEPLASPFLSKPHDVL